MPTPRRNPPRGLPDSVRRKLEVATALAWEALVETHVAEATGFVALLADRVPLEDALVRYFREMDLTDTMVMAIRTRVLLAAEAEAEAVAGARDADRREASEPAAGEGSQLVLHPGSPESEEGWRRFMPDAVVRGVRERQRRSEEVERTVQLALARSEEALIRTHVENAIGFAALLDDHVPLDRSVQQYLGAVLLTGCRGQVVFQRTMARLADVHLGS